MLDLYNREIDYMRISVTDRCNLRCRYCMPAGGIAKKSHEEIMRMEEILAVAEAGAALGIRKIRVTGGEPLVRKGIVKLCGALCRIPGIAEVDLTTNGILLPNYASSLRAAGVRGVNISLDTLKEEKYRYMTRIGTLAEALEGIRAAEDAGFERIKINMVLMDGFNQDEIRDFALLSMTRNLEIRFIELMPIGRGIGFCDGNYLSCDRVLEQVPELIPLDRMEGTAALYRLPGGVGKVGLITPVSRTFCDSCNKIRITADGRLKPCLHSAEEIFLRGKTSAELRGVLREGILRKPRESGIGAGGGISHAGRNMNRIGG